MKVAIHQRIGSFSDRWIEYCKKNNVPYKIVNCYDSNIMEQLKDCDALMWHHHHNRYRDVLAAKPILFALEHAKVKVFPDFKTNWHFDDKVAQKYLLEAIGAPLVPSYIFYDKEKAFAWIEKTDFPMVWKLKGGAGSANVKLIRTKSQARKLINKAFGRGFSRFNRWDNFKERYHRFKNGKDNILGLFKGIGRLVIPTEFAKMSSREKGYVYFQKFIPNNDFDTRVIIIGDRAFALTRGVRENDFRASGSGNISYNTSLVDIETIKISFEVNKIIKAQSVAFDYVIYKGKPLIVEISYGFAMKAYDNCPGYWDSELEWYEGKFNPQEWMVEDLISKIKK